MPSKKRSNTSKQPQQLKKEPCFFVDRNLGSLQLPEQLRKAGVNLIVHDDVYPRDERDPWIFYNCGKQGLILLTSDREFMKSFPHMAAVQLGGTTIITFTRNDFNSAVRGNAFLKARPSILRSIDKRAGQPFIGSIGMEGTFSIIDRDPHPQRKQCAEKDWQSYERVCKAEGRLTLGPKP